jgi:hypothetical protein
LLICVKTAVSEWLRPFGILPPVAVMALLFFGVQQLGYFQRQERVWISALDRAKLIATVNIGLAPFVFWWNKLPTIPFFSLGVGLLTLSSLLFLFNLNHVLQRLAAMLPDETLRLETRLFTSINLYLLLTIAFLVLFYLILNQLTSLPPLLLDIARVLENSRQWLLLFLVLLPLALTMTLIWKIKEVVLAGVFGPEI